MRAGGVRVREEGLCASVGGMCGSVVEEVVNVGGAFGSVVEEVVREGDVGVGVEVGWKNS